MRVWNSSDRLPNIRDMPARYGWTDEVKGKEQSSSLREYKLERLICASLLQSCIITLYIIPSVCTGHLLPRFGLPGSAGGCQGENRTRTIDQRAECRHRRDLLGGSGRQSQLISGAETDTCSETTLRGSESDSDLEVQQEPVVSQREIKREQTEWWSPCTLSNFTTDLGYQLQNHTKIEMARETENQPWNN